MTGSRFKLVDQMPPEAVKVLRNSECKNFSVSEFLRTIPGFAAVRGQSLLLDVADFNHHLGFFLQDEITLAHQYDRSVISFFNHARNELARTFTHVLLTYD